jgi:hypothetical protein
MTFPAMNQQISRPPAPPQHHEVTHENDKQDAAETKPEPAQAPEHKDSHSSAPPPKASPEVTQRINDFARAQVLTRSFGAFIQLAQAPQTPTATTTTSSPTDKSDKEIHDTVENIIKTNASGTPDEVVKRVAEAGKNLSEEDRNALMLEMYKQYDAYGVANKKPINVDVINHLHDSGQIDDATYASFSSVLMQGANDGSLNRDQVDRALGIADVGTSSSYLHSSGNLDQQKQFLEAGDSSTRNAFLQNYTQEALNEISQDNPGTYALSRAEAVLGMVGQFGDQQEMIASSFANAGVEGRANIMENLSDWGMLVDRNGSNRNGETDGLSVLINAVASQDSMQYTGYVPGMGPQFTSKYGDIALEIVRFAESSNDLAFRGGLSSDQPRSEALGALFESHYDRIVNEFTTGSYIGQLSGNGDQALAAQTEQNADATIFANLLRYTALNAENSHSASLQQSLHKTEQHLLADAQADSGTQYSEAAKQYGQFTSSVVLGITQPALESWSDKKDQSEFLSRATDAGFFILGVGAGSAAAKVAGTAYDFLTDFAGVETGGFFDRLLGTDGAREKSLSEFTDAWNDLVSAKLGALPEGVRAEAEQPFKDLMQRIIDSIRSENPGIVLNAPDQ